MNRKNFSQTSNCNGFTLSELLVTILIIILVGITIGGGFTAIHNSYDRISKKAEAEILLSTTAYKISHLIRYASEIDQSEDKVYFTDPNTGYRICIDNANKYEHHIKGIAVRYCSGEQIVESHQLLSDDTIGEQLTPKIKEIHWDKPSNYSTFTIEIYSNNSPKPLISDTISVDLLNE